MYGQNWPPTPLYTNAKKEEKEKEKKEKEEKERKEPKERIKKKEKKKNREREENALFRARAPRNNLTLIILYVEHAKNFIILKTVRSKTS